MFEFDSLKKWIDRQEENQQDRKELEEETSLVPTSQLVENNSKTGQILSNPKYPGTGYSEDCSKTVDSKSVGFTGADFAFGSEKSTFVAELATSEGGRAVGSFSKANSILDHDHIPKDTASGAYHIPINQSVSPRFPASAPNPKSVANHTNLSIREKIEFPASMNENENQNIELISMDDSAFGSDNDEDSKIDFMTNLPFELAVKTMSYLSPAHSILLVSKIWYSVANDNIVWKEEYLRKFGLLPCLKVNPTHSINSTFISASEKIALEREFYLENVVKIRDWKMIYRKRMRLLQNWKEGLVGAQFLDGHSDAVYCLQFDASKIISGSRDRTIKVWDLSSLTCSFTFYGHAGSVLCLQYNDKYIISGSSDSTIRIWDLKTKETIRVLTGHSQPVLDIQFYGPDHIVSCSKDWSIKVWCLHTGELIRTIEGHTAAVNSIHIYEDYLASASGDSTIRLWDLSNGSLIRVLKGHERGLACVQFHKDIVVSGSNDKSIKIWNASTGQCTHTLSRHKGLVRTLAFDEHHLVSGSYDQTIQVWNPITGNLMLDMGQAHRSWVFHIQIDAARIISSSQDFKIIIWDFSQGENYDEFFV